MIESFHARFDEKVVADYFLKTEANSFKILKCTVQFTMYMSRATKKAEALRHFKVDTVVKIFNFS